MLLGCRLANEKSIASNASQNLAEILGFCVYPLLDLFFFNSDDACHQSAASRLHGLIDMETRGLRVNLPRGIDEGSSEVGLTWSLSYEPQIRNLALTINGSLLWT